MPLLFLRTFFTLMAAGGSALLVLQYSTHPAYVMLGALLGALVAGVIMYASRNVRRMSTPKLVGGFLGLILGLVCGNLLAGAFLALPDLSANATLAMRVLLNLVFAYLGVLVGTVKGGDFSLAAMRAFFGGPTLPENIKILDTSVIIDGRVADICESGFLEGQLVIPQFILKELQQIADSSDSLKRNRGRRGLDILKKIQKSAEVQIVDFDFPRVKEVDAKLVELAKKLGGKIITNDFNLNKVAELQGIGVMNINQLANAVKPVVLPGEMMQVYVLKEGKEYGQGVAYLDDGTMVVIDNARKFIGRNIEVAVTSVLQTPAGRMIFTKPRDDIERESTFNSREN